MILSDVLSGASAVSGAANGVTVSVDFGASFTHFASAVVTGQTWVTAGSEIVATPADSAYVEAAVLSFQPVVHSIVAGTGFTLSVYTPVEAKGAYQFFCVGV